MSARGPGAGAYQPRRSAGLIISLTLNIAVVVGVLYFAQTRPALPRPLTRMPAMVMSVVYVPATQRELPVLIAVRPPPARVAVRIAEPLPDLPVSLPPRTVEHRRAEVVPTSAPLPVEAPPKPAPPKPAASVMVGAFPDNTASVRAPESGRQLERVGFDAPTERGSEPKPAAPTLGGFDRPVARDARSGNNPQTDTVVAETGFAPAIAAPPPESRVIRETGFGNSNSPERSRRVEAQPPAAITPSGFNTVRAGQPVSSAATPPRPTMVPVELLSKPTPTYSAEARTQKIEGEVLLEVEFASTGIVRVLRVVRGLGHGLDDAAVRAAQQIQFKPAQDDGRPIDFRTTLHIVFRLA